MSQSIKFEDDPKELALTPRDRILRKIERSFKDFATILKMGCRPTLFIPDASVSDWKVLELRHCNAYRFLRDAKMLLSTYETVLASEDATFGTSSTVVSPEPPMCQPKIEVDTTMEEAKVETSTTIATSTERPQESIVASTNETEPEISITATKGPRGRPKQVTIAPADQTEPGTSNAATKRPRGRPKKPAEPRPTPQPQRKRGRPLGSKNKAKAKPRRKAFKLDLQKLIDLRIINPFDNLRYMDPEEGFHVAFMQGNSKLKAAEGTDEMRQYPTVDAWLRAALKMAPRQRAGLSNEAKRLLGVYRTMYSCMREADDDGKSFIFRFQRRKAGWKVEHLTDGGGSGR